MKERPIIFSTNMVQAIRDGRKTQTRRVIKPQPEWRERELNSLSSEGWAWITTKASLLHWHDIVDFSNALIEFCPYKVGSRLWVRETCHLMKRNMTTTPVVVYKADQSDPSCVSKWRPSIHMPRWASRTTLEITEVRAERLQKITEEDAKAEGVDCCPNAIPDYRHHFMVLWDSLNAKRGYDWEVNPWVWVLSFSLLK